MSRNWLIKGICCLCSIPFIVLGSINLWLSSDSGRAYVEYKITARIGIETKVVAVSWAPWLGVKIKGLDIYSNRKHIKVFHVKEVQVSLQYFTALTGAFKVRRIVVISPTLEIVVGDTEVLPTLPQRDSVETAVANISPKKAVNSLSTFSGEHREASSKQQGSPDVVDLQVSRPAAKVGKRTGELEARKVKRVRDIQALDGDARPYTDLRQMFNLLEKVECRDAQVVIADIRGEEIVVLSGCDVRFPYEDKSGEVSFDSFNLLGVDVIDDAVFLIKKAGEDLKLSTEVFSLRGVKVAIESQLSSNGFFELKVENEPYSAYSDESIGAWGYREFRYTGTMRGSVFHPNSWRGEYLATAKDLFIDHPSKRLFFDRFSSSGTLKCLQVKMTQFWLDSDPVKVFGIGQINKSGDTYFKFKTLATADEADNLNRFAGGIRIQLPFQLYSEIPNLYSADFDVAGNLRGLKCKTHKHWVPLKDIIFRAKHFLEYEKREEELK